MLKPHLCLLLRQLAILRRGGAIQPDLWFEPPIPEPFRHQTEPVRRFFCTPMSRNPA